LVTSERRKAVPYKGQDIPIPPNEVSAIVWLSRAFCRSKKRSPFRKAEMDERVRKSGTPKVFVLSAGQRAFFKGRRNSNMNKSRLGGRDSRGKFETKLQKA
jgi:hypothetical protein